MLSTKGKVTVSFEGINQQDFQELQLVAGAYPYQTGLQQRIPGKTLIETMTGPVGSIYAFYNVFGQFYNLISWDGNIQITPVPYTSLRLPALPPTNNGLLFDDFSGYSPDGLISLLWGAGIWNGSVGVCQTTIQGYFDPFQIYGGFTIPPYTLTPWTLALSPINTTTSLQAKAGPGGGATIPSAPPGSAAFLYPPGHMPNVLLEMQFGESDNTCTGSGYEYVEFDDLVYFVYYPGGSIIDTLNVTSIAIGGKTNFHGVTFGRTGNIDAGVLVGTCPGPPFPVPAIWNVFPDGSYTRTQ